MRVPLLFCLPLILLASPGRAAEIRDCADVGVDLTTVVVPANANVATIYEGQVALYNVDTIEPACCSIGVAIVLPEAPSELGTAKCVAVVGFREVDIVKAPRTYDPQLGMLITVPTAISTADGGRAEGPTLRIRINLTKSTVVLTD